MATAAALQATPAQAEPLEFNCDPKVHSWCGNLELGKSKPPEGAIDSLSRHGTNLVVSGWAADPDVPKDPIRVHIYSDGQYVTTVTADGWRYLLHKDYPQYGDRHRFEAVIPVRETEADQQICAYAVDAGGGVRHALPTSVGCQTLHIRHSPVGLLDQVTRDGDTVEVRGWAADPDDPDTAIDVRIYVDDVLARTVPANRYQYAKHDYGNYHGFEVTDLPTNKTHGKHNVCVEAVNILYGQDARIGCKTYTVGEGLAPATIKVSSLRDTSISLTWTNNSTKHDGYRVERSDAGGPWHKVWSGDRDSRTFRDYQLTPDTTYCYRVIVYNAFADEVAAEICATTLRPPLPSVTGVTVLGTTDNTVTLRWIDNSTDEEHFVVQYWQPGSAIYTQYAPAHAGTGEVIYTVQVNEMSPDSEVILNVFPYRSGHLIDQQPPRVAARLTGPPKVEVFEPSTLAVQACIPQPVTLSWKTTNATRIVVKQGDQVIADRSQPTPAPWEGTVSGGTHDGGVNYTITAYAPDGRTTSTSTAVAKISALPLVRSVTYTNTGWRNLEVWYYHWGYPAEKVGNLPAGRGTGLAPTFTVVPPNCRDVEIRVIDPATGKIVFHPLTVRGYNQGVDLSYSGG